MRYLQVAVLQVLDMRDKASHVDGVVVILIRLKIVDGGDLRGFRIEHFLFLELQDLVVFLLLPPRGRLLVHFFLFLYFLEQESLPVVADVPHFLPHLLQVLELVQAKIVDFSHNECEVIPVRFLVVALGVLLALFIQVGVVEFVSFILFCDVVAVLFCQIIELLLYYRLQLPTFPQLLRILLRIANVFWRASQHLRLFLLYRVQHTARSRRLLNLVWLATLTISRLNQRLPIERFIILVVLFLGLLRYHLLFLLLVQLPLRPLVRLLSDLIDLLLL